MANASFAYGFPTNEEFQGNTVQVAIRGYLVRYERKK